MPLVGIIDRGTVERIIQSVTFARGDVLILLAREQQFGHVLFEEGTIVTARLDELKDDQALAALGKWTSGHYTLIKRGQQESGARAHVLLNGLPTKPRRTLERWLKRHGYRTSVVGYPQHAMEIISYAQPDLILTGCPRESLGLSCTDLVSRLRREMHVAPLIVAVEVPRGTCPEPSPPCVRIPGTTEELERVLALDWPHTRLSVREAEAEETAKIIPPTRLRVPPSDEMLAQVVGAAPSAGLRGRDLIPPLLLLVLGSLALWTAWWLLGR